MPADTFFYITTLLSYLQAFSTVLLSFSMPLRPLTSQLGKISVHDLEDENFQPTVTLRAMNIKSEFIYSKIKDHIQGTNILDIGTGIGGIAGYLTTKGYSVESIDVKNDSYIKEFPSKIYDGNQLPYKNKQFDTALLIHVLHHCQNPIRVLKEAVRTADRVIFIEDTYRNKLEHLLVSAMDMLGNGEFYAHPYHPFEKWQQILDELNYKTIYKEAYTRFTYYIYYGRYALFVIEEK